MAYTNNNKSRIDNCLIGVRTRLQGYKDIFGMEKSVMRRFIQEDVSFEITVVDGKKNEEGFLDCRNGHEVGDRYVCEYGCPVDFCQKCMLKAFPIMEAVRAGGDLRNLGGESESKIRFCCPTARWSFSWKLNESKKLSGEKNGNDDNNTRIDTRAV